MLGGRSKALRAVLLSGVAAVASCDSRWSPYEVPEPDELPVELAFEGEHVRVSVQSGVPACGRSFEYLDNFAALYLEGSSDGSISEPVEYFLLDAEVIHRADVCDDHRACARRGRAYSQSPADVHELVHALRQLQFDGSFPGTLFLEEGIAQMHYTVPLGWDDGFAPSDLSDVVGESIPARLYDPAAHLLAVVADDDSFEAAERLVDASGALEDGVELATLVEDQLSMSLDELDALYSDHPNCSAAGRARMLVECAAMAEVWAEGDWSPAPFIIRSVSAFACENSAVIGPLDGRLWTSFTIDVPEEGRYDLDVETEPGQQLELTSCDATCGEDVDLLWDDSREASLDLSAGRYVVRLSRALGDGQSVAFQLRGPLPP